MTCPSAATCSPDRLDRACAYTYCPADVHGSTLVPCAACGAPCLPGELDLECDGRRRPVCRICSRDPDPVIRQAVRERDARERQIEESEQPAQAGGQLSLEL